MPSIGDSIPRKRKIEGYKIAIRDGGRYRSIFTWNVYQEGKNDGKYDKKIERVTEVPFPLQTHVWFCYDEKYNGYTTIFKNQEDAILENIGIGKLWLQTLNFDIVVLKVIMSGDLRHKKHGKFDVYLGNKFEKINEIKTLLTTKN